MENYKPSTEKKILCQCLYCNEVFEYKDHGIVIGGHGSFNNVCPDCKGSFKFIKTPFDYYLDKFLFVNTDDKYYSYNTAKGRLYR